MITSYITPSKRAQTAEFEAMFQKHCAEGHEPKRFKHGESGGKTRFYAGNPKSEITKLEGVKL